MVFELNTFALHFEITIFVGVRNLLDVDPKSNRNFLIKLLKKNRSRYTIKHTLE